MKLIHNKTAIFLFLSCLFFADIALANYDKRGEARLSIGLESGFSFSKLLSNYKNDTLVERDGHQHTVLFEKSWNDLILWSNRVNFNVALFKIGPGDLILQGYGSYGDSMSGEYMLTERLDPVDKVAAGYEYLYSSNSFGDIDVAAYDFSINLAYQIPITPDGGRNRDYYIFNRKVHSFVLPKIGYGHFRQNYSISSEVNFSTLEKYSDDYISNWKSPFIGVELVSYISDNHKVSVGGNIYYVRYDTTADIGLDEAKYISSGGTSNYPYYLRDQNSIKADGSGAGFSFDVGYSYQPGDNFSYDFNARYLNTRIKNGDQTYYYRNNSSSTDTINEASWDSFLLSAGIGYHF